MSFLKKKLRELRYKEFPGNNKAMNLYKIALFNLSYNKEEIIEIAERFANIRKDSSIADQLFLDDLFESCIKLSSKNSNR